MDIKRRDQLLQRIGDVNKPLILFPLVTLEEFFEGNDVVGSICPNAWSEKDQEFTNPTPAEVYEKLKSISRLHGVADVRVMVTQYEEFLGWPSSDRVVFITSRSKDDIRLLIGEKFSPDEVEFEDFSISESLQIPDGMHAICAWWD